MRVSMSWKKFDEEMPANRAYVLIWNNHDDVVQVALFSMYSASRYEFLTEDGAPISIHAITHWQDMPDRPVDLPEHVFDGGA